jgi:peptide deformylase
MNLKLVDPSDPILRLKCAPFDFKTTNIDIIEFAHDLVRFMYDNNGIGLAANQVGIGLRIFALRAHPQNFVCINPRVTWTSEKEVLLEEGCLTYPNLVVKIKRPEFIRARFFTPNGDSKIERFIGMTARCFQHEMDHLEGKIFYEQANRYHREQAFKKRKKIEKGEIAYKIRTHNSDTLLDELYPYV